MFTRGILVALLLSAQTLLAGEFLVKYKNKKGLMQIQQLSESSGMDFRGYHPPGHYAKIYTQIRG